MVKANVLKQAKIDGNRACQELFVNELTEDFAFLLYKGKDTGEAVDDLDHFVECDFSGYSRKIWNEGDTDVPTWNEDLSRAEQPPFEVQWAHTGGETDNDVLGWAFVNIADEKVLFYKDFDAPRIMAEEVHIIKIECLFYVCDCCEEEEEE